jgi:hypothetical protein
MSDNVTLNAGGAIADDASAATRITGALLTLDAVTGIGSGDALETTAASLDVSNTGAGGIEITELDDVTLTDVDTANGSIAVSAGGTITVGTITAGMSGNVTLNAGGAIADDASAATGPRCSPGCRSTARPPRRPRCRLEQPSRTSGSG